MNTEAEDINKAMKEILTDNSEPHAMEYGISMLRQWINEKPASLLVTNQDIKDFLFMENPVKGDNPLL